MQSKKINELATNLTPSTSDLVTIGDPSTGQLKKATLQQIANVFGSSGTVNSVGLSIGTMSAFSVSGSPITTSGVLAIAATGSGSQYIKGDGTLGTLNTSNVPESGNLYYTDARSRAAITLTTTNSSGPATYTGGAINVPNYTLSGLGGVVATRNLTINGVTFDLSADRSWTVGAAAGVSSFNTRTGAVSLTSGDVTSALGYTPLTSFNTRTGAVSLTSGDVTGALGFTPIGLTSIGATNPLFYNSTFGTFSIQVANTSQSGYLTNADWNTFNSKQPAGSYLTANQNIFFNPSGDVTGTSNGSTTLNPVLTLATISQGGGSSFVKINIDGKGRVTGNSSVTGTDIVNTLGYTPYNSSNPSGFINSSGSCAFASLAGSISGFNNPTAAGTANTIAYRDGGGQLYATAFFESSDIRFKNILETNPKIDLNGIQVIKFNRKENASIRYGYSAQQVKEFLPDAVSGESELVVNYSDVHTLKIAALERRILELENKLK